MRADGEFRQLLVVVVAGDVVEFALQDGKLVGSDESKRLPPRRQDRTFQETRGPFGRLAFGDEWVERRKNDRLQRVALAPCRGEGRRQRSENDIRRKAAGIALQHGFDRASQGDRLVRWDCPEQGGQLFALLGLHRHSRGRGVQPLPRRSPPKAKLNGKLVNKR